MIASDAPTHGVIPGQTRYSYSAVNWKVVFFDSETRLVITADNHPELYAQLKALYLDAVMSGKIPPTALISATTGPTVSIEPVGDTIVRHAAVSAPAEAVQAAENITATAPLQIVAETPSTGIQSAAPGQVTMTLPTPTPAAPGTVETTVAAPPQTTSILPLIGIGGLLLLLSRKGR